MTASHFIFDAEAPAKWATGGQRDTRKHPQIQSPPIGGNVYLSRRNAL